jgi:hypothetical protein
MNKHYLICWRNVALGLFLGLVNVQVFFCLVNTCRCCCLHLHLLLLASPDLVVLCCSFHFVIAWSCDQGWR